MSSSPTGPLPSVRWILRVGLYIVFFAAGGAIAEGPTQLEFTPSPLEQQDDAGSFSPEALIATGRVRIRVLTEPELGSEIVVGQQTRLLVEILTDTRFRRAPRYPALAIAGAITLMPEQMGTNFTERIDHKTYTGQRRSYVLYPQRAGTLEIPPIQIELAVEEHGSASPPFALQTAPLTIEISERSGIDERLGLVTTPRLRVVDEWTGLTGDLAAGDAVERTIRIKGEEVVGMLLPPLRFEAPPGVAVYADPPRIRDRINRGRYRSERTQTVTYILKERGSFQIPAIDVPWWNVEDHQLEVERLDAQTIDVTGSLFGSPGDAAASNRLASFGSRSAHFLRDLGRRLAEHWFGLLSIGGLVIVVAISLRAFGPTVREGVQQALRKHLESERRAFSALDRAVKSQNRKNIVAAYWAWRDRLQQSDPHITELSAQRIPEDPRISGAWREFEAGHYQNAPDVDYPVSSRELRDELRRLRVHLLSTARQTRSASSSEPSDDAARVRLNPLRP